MNRREFKRQSLRTLEWEFDAIKQCVVDFAKYGNEKIFEGEALGSSLPKKIVEAAIDIQLEEYGVVFRRGEKSRLKDAVRYAYNNKYAQMKK